MNSYKSIASGYAFYTYKKRNDPARPWWADWGMKDKFKNRSCPR